MEINVKVGDESLWSECYKIGTEMIITKAGRRMYPRLRFKISGLDRNMSYQVIVILKRVDEFRYKFEGGLWQNNGMGEAIIAEDLPWNILWFKDEINGVFTGEELCSRTVDFDTFKMSNNSEEAQTKQDIIFVQSMHKYVPVLKIFKYTGAPFNYAKPFYTFSSPITEFLAVTCYQNPLLTNLKVFSNPFAKGFRDRSPNSGRRRKRTVIYTEASQVPPCAKKTNSPQNFASFGSPDSVQVSPSYSVMQNSPNFPLNCAQRGMPFFYGHPGFAFPQYVNPQGMTSQLDLCQSQPDMASIAQAYAMYDQYLPPTWLNTVQAAQSAVQIPLTWTSLTPVEKQPDASCEGSPETIGSNDTTFSPAVTPSFDKNAPLYDFGYPLPNNVYPNSYI